MSVAWVLQAACATDPNPAAWTSTSIPRGPDAWTDPENLRARAICGTCQVRAECLQFAELEELNGQGPEVEAIYGGLSPIERRRIRRKLKLRAVETEERGGVYRV